MHFPEVPVASARDEHAEQRSIERQTDSEDGTTSGAVHKYHRDREDYLSEKFRMKADLYFAKNASISPSIWKKPFYSFATQPKWETEPEDILAQYEAKARGFLQLLPV
jgi:hypothetical protein